MTTDLVDRLSTHKTLGAAPREELAWLAAHGTLRQLEAGEVLSAGGKPVSGLFIVLSGLVSIYIDRGAGKRKVIEWHGGDVAGMLPYSRLVSPPADSVAQEPTEILAIAVADMDAMIHACHQVTGFLVHTMLDRAREFTSSGLHDEKMISLGKLSAGLAHELNNPASAIERSASLLEDRIEDAERATRAVSCTRLTTEQFDAIDRIRETCLAGRPHGVLSPIKQAEREDAIADWLADHGVDDDVAGPLGETSVTIEALDRIATSVDGPTLGAVLRWVAAGSSVRAIASEIQEASMRITGLVTAIKGFTHMDQAAVAEPVDLKASLGNTVTVLASKARSKSVAVTVTLPPDLPRALGFVGELNQIWSNLIDNALDAVDKGGHVEVSAFRERERVIVRIVDDGPGITPEVRARMFDPFFTTKPVGKGTGLGLDIVRRLVNHNDGVLDVDSVPGRTEFRVSVPVAAMADGAPA